MVKTCTEEDLIAASREILSDKEWNLFRAKAWLFVRAELSLAGYKSLAKALEQVQQEIS